MRIMSFFMIINSDENKQFFPNNLPYNFKCKVNQQLKLSKNWKFALTEISTSEKASNNERICFNIYSDLCGETFVDGVKLPLLRRVDVKRNENKLFHSWYYIPIVKTEINEIEFIIKTNKGQSADYLTNTITLILHFKDFSLELQDK